jgi:probable rRNA maturation factor
VDDAPDIKIIVEAGDWPTRRKLQALAKRAVNAAVQAGALHVSPLSVSPPQGGRGRAPMPELSLVFTDDAGIRALNARYRGKDRATNVLSFPQKPGPQKPGPQKPGPQKTGALLGDVILAAETVAREAALADKPLENHMAHLIIHGFLHLLGFDHQGDREAEKMEQLERVALKRLGISDPYAPAFPK